jgi:hypothetical protein
MTATPRQFPFTSKSTSPAGTGKTPAPANGGASPSATQPSAVQALTFLEQQASLYEQLQTLSQAQGPLIDDGPSDALLAILARRQGVIAQLTKLNGQLKPLLARWTEITAGLAPTERDKAARLLAEVETRRQAIMEQDERDSLRLKQMQTDLRIDIERMDRSGKAMRAYRPPGLTAGNVAGGPGTSGSRYTDRRG